MSEQGVDKLKTEGRDLLQLALHDKIVKPLFRDKVIDQILDAFARRRSVLLVGEEGVGKTAVIHGLAHRLNKTLSNRLAEIATSAVLTGTLYQGEWETKADNIIRPAIESDTVLYFSDIWNLPFAGKSSGDPSNLLDLIRPRISAQELLLIGELTPQMLQKSQNVHAFVSLFEIVNIEPLTRAQVEDIIYDKAKQLQIDINEQICARLLKLRDRFATESAGPGSALQLLEQVKHYQKQKIDKGVNEALSPEFIDKVFGIYSGLPLFVISESIKRPVSEMRNWFKDGVIGQDQAIDSIVETITLFKAGLHDPTKPIGSFLFVGPTGVGKTELARCLAEYLFGSSRRLLRFDMSEFKDYHAFEMLVGSPNQRDKPARLAEPVRAQPFQVVLFDEIEKAHANIWDLLLQILDEGRLTLPGGKTVNFRSTIIIATSNVGVREASQNRIGFTAETDSAIDLDQMRVALESHFRPEFLNRFQYITTFHALSKEQVRLIAKKEIKAILKREGISARNLLVEVDDTVLDQVVSQGYDQRYGARALKREIQRQVIMPIATFLVEQQVEPGCILKLELRKNFVRVRLIDTEQSIAHKREREPVKDKNGKTYTRDDVVRESSELRRLTEELAQELNEDELRDSMAQLLEQRQSHTFWKDPAQANQLILELDHLTNTVRRIEALRDNVDDIDTMINAGSSRQQLQQVTALLLQYNEKLVFARRELLYMGRQGEHDVLIEIAPIGRPGHARDLIYDIYSRWAVSRNLNPVMIFEPMQDDEPIMFALKGHYAFGLIRLEAGLHRVREEERTSVARVTLAPWAEPSEEVGFRAHRALKKQGQLHGRIRSRLEIAQTDNLIVQNERTLAENRELAADIMPSWIKLRINIDEVVRRYDLHPAFKIKDYLTDQMLGRQEIMNPRSFHQLLCNRLDISDPL